MASVSATTCLLETLSDSMTLELLTNAVTLAPCAHKVNSATAKKLIQASNPALCPLCRSSIKSIAIDHTVQQAASVALKAHQQMQSLEKQLAAAQKKIAAYESFVQKINAENMYYSALAQLKYSFVNPLLGHYVPSPTPQGKRVQLLTFKGEKKSLIGSVELLGSDNGSFSLTIWFHPAATKAQITALMKCAKISGQVCASSLELNDYAEMRAILKPLIECNSTSLKSPSLTQTVLALVKGN